VAGEHSLPSHTGSSSGTPKSWGNDSSPPDRTSSERVADFFAPFVIKEIISDAERVGFCAARRATALVTKGAAIEVPE
jgi:hypothetical protein